MNNAEQMKEIQDRLRRIETRLTKYLESVGFETNIRRPTFRDGMIVVPSLMTTLADCVNVVPDGWDKGEEIFVEHKHQPVLSFFLPDVRV